MVEESEGAGGGVRCGLIEGEQGGGLEREDGVLGEGGFVGFDGAPGVVKAAHLEQGCDEVGSDGGLGGIAGEPGLIDGEGGVVAEGLIVGDGEGAGEGQPGGLLVGGEEGFGRGGGWGGGGFEGGDLLRG